MGAFKHNVLVALDVAGPLRFAVVPEIAFLVVHDSLVLLVTGLGPRPKANLGHLIMRPVHLLLWRYLPLTW